jgi:hypothetical protein
MSEEKKGYIDIDKAIAEKFINKYGFAFDMFLLFKNWKKIEMKDIQKAFAGIIARGGLKVDRECSVDEFVEKSYSVYMRRFARMPRKMLYNHYKNVYGDIVNNAHKAFLTDRPHNIDDDLLVEIKGGHIDADSLSAPGYVALMKTRIADNITAIKVIYNSQLHRIFWSEMVNINMMVGGVLTSIYETEGLYGRSTSLSVRSETIARVAKGQVKETLQERSALQNDLVNYGLDINKVLDICDAEVSALNVPTELRMIYETMETQCKETGTIDALGSLIKRIESHVIPATQESKKLPSLAETFTFAREFIMDTSATKFGSLRDGSTDKKYIDSELDSASAGLAQSILAYTRYATLMSEEPQCEMKYLVLSVDNQSIIKPVN